ncbi:MAG: HD domain-containing phosphohydrolase, partial [Acidobacteriota bacterium]|nr:HD domain-containing phosphohydrolase [Acidobacteriota bacterium]
TISASKIPDTRSNKTMHPVIGAEVLTPAPFLQDALPLVLHHHERYDGKGYPDGLMSSQLSDLTHIIMAADAYDAMTSNRPYRAALTTEQALSELEAGRGAQFSPAVVDAMQELVDRLGAGV